MFALCHLDFKLICLMMDIYVSHFIVSSESIEPMGGARMKDNCFIDVFLLQLSLMVSELRFAVI
jgi:hypothetical protein